MVIGGHIDLKCRALLPSFESFKKCKELFVMHVVVEFQGRKSPGVECNGVQFAIQSCDRKDCGKCIVRGISLDCELSVWDPVGKDWSCGESLFKCFKG